jgi:hypothetical protein
MIEKLNIYKDAYLLTNKIYQALPQMDKLHRYTIGSRILDRSLDMFKWITLANKAREKQERIKYLDDFMSDFEMLRVYLRICADNKFIKLTTLTDLYILIENISKQLSGWRYATTRM